MVVKHVSGESLLRIEIEYEIKVGSMRNETVI